MSKKIKRIYALFAGGVLALLLHYGVNLLFKIQEPVLIIMSVVLFIGFVVFVIMAFIEYLRNDEPKDIGNLKWLGIIGVLGFVFSFPSSSMLFLMFLFLLLFFAPKAKHI